MKLGIISDIHSNYPALKTVMEYFDKQDIFTVICAGDVVGYYTSPNICCDIVKIRCQYTVKGNHDAAVTGNTLELSFFNSEASFSNFWNEFKLKDINKLWLKNLPERERFKINSISFLLVHGTPSDPYDYLVPGETSSWDKKLSSIFASVPEDVLIVGHTHKPKVWYGDDKIFINPGAIGQPRDRDFRASFAVFDTITRKAEIIRLEYPIEKTIEHAKSFGISKFLAERLRKGM